MHLPTRCLLTGVLWQDWYNSQIPRRSLSFWTASGLASGLALRIFPMRPPVQLQERFGRFERCPSGSSVRKLQTFENIWKHLKACKLWTSSRVARLKSDLFRKWSEQVTSARPNRTRCIAEGANDEFRLRDVRRHSRYSNACSSFAKFLPDFC